MANGIPAREVDTILSELSVLLDSSNTDTFQLRRHEQTVERLWKQNAISAVEYHTTRAFIEFGKYRRSGALAAANNALALAPSDTTAQCNALTTYVGLVEVDAAIFLMQRMVADLKDDKDVLRVLVDKAFDLLQFELVAQLFEVWDKLCVNDRPSGKVHRRTFERCLEMMKAAGLADSDTAALLRLARQSLEEQGCEVWRTSRNMLDDGTILYFLHVKEDASRCAELNFAIAERLVQERDNPGADFVSIMSRPLADLDRMFWPKESGE